LTGGVSALTILLSGLRVVEVKERTMQRTRKVANPIQQLPLDFTPQREGRRKRRLSIRQIFESFTTVELIFARAVIFLLYLLGLWTVLAWALHK
jgi:hypothetical protein